MTDSGGKADRLCTIGIILSFLWEQYLLHTSSMHPPQATCHFQLWKGEAQDNLSYPHLHLCETIQPLHYVVNNLFNTYDMLESLCEVLIQINDSYLKYASWNVEITLSLLFCNCMDKIWKITAHVLYISSNV